MAAFDMTEVEDAKLVYWVILPDKPVFLLGNWHNPFRLCPTVNYRNLRLSQLCFKTTFSAIAISRS